MREKNKISVMFFTNGNTAVFENEKQRAELQESWALLFVEFLLKKGVDPTKCNYAFQGRGNAKVVKTDEGYNWIFEK